MTYQKIKHIHKEINKIKKYIKDSNFELIFLLDLETWLRLGELLALDWKHINLKLKELTVEKSVKEVYIMEKIRYLKFLEIPDF